MKQIVFDLGLYNVHPYYDSYACDSFGNIFNIYTGKRLRQYRYRGYLFVKIKKFTHKIPYHSHKFVWECFNGMVPTGSKIEHIDGKTKHNCIGNLNFVSKK